MINRRGTSLAVWLTWWVELSLCRFRPSRTPSQWAEHGGTPGPARSVSSPSHRTQRSPITNSLSAPQTLTRGGSEKAFTLMTITSVEHPPILTPLLRTVPLHSHVFISLVRTLSPLVLFQFLYPRVSIDSPEEPEATASDMVTSKSCRGKVPEGKDSITP